MSLKDVKHLYTSYPKVSRSSEELGKDARKEKDFERLLNKRYDLLCPNCGEKLTIRDKRVSCSDIDCLGPSSQFNKRSIPWKA